MFDANGCGPVVEDDWVPSAVDVADYEATLLDEWDIGFDSDVAGDVTVEETPGQLLERAVSLGRLASWTQAGQVEALAVFAQQCPLTGPKDRGFGARADISEFVVDEISCALSWTRRSAEYQLELALQLADTLPETLSAWKAGLLDLPRVRVIADRTAGLTPELAAGVQARVLPQAGQATTGQLRRMVDRAVIQADPAGANARHERARHERHVEVRPGVEGMSTLRAELSAEDAALTYATLSLIARTIPGSDPRTMNQRRADCLVDLVTGRTTPAGAATQQAEMPGTAATSDSGGSAEPQVSHYTGPNSGDTRCECGVPGPRGSRTAPRPGKPLIHLQVTAGTLLGMDDTPAELAGHGPIPSDLARRIAAEGTWHRILTDPVSGTILECGRKTYRPPAALADHVRARDRVCRFVTCAIPAHRCDLDHLKRWRHGGTTTPDNLWALCRHHHRLKDTDSGWTVTGDPQGIVTWTSPSGQQYESYPHHYRDDDPVPPGPVDESSSHQTTLASHTQDAEPEPPF